MLSRLIIMVIWAFFASALYAQPVNDNCTNASVINISSNGYGLGTFNGANSDIARATVQSGETFAPAIFVAGQTDKSVWYKFKLPVTRVIRVTLTQPGANIQAGDVGFTLYKSPTCLPGTASVSTKLTPIETFGSTFHPCVEPGDYLVQVSAKARANGQVFIQLQLSDSTGAVYDKPSQAYRFGTLDRPEEHVDYDIECQSVESAAEICSILPEAARYNKSTWHTFRTPASFEYVAVFLASPTGSFSGGTQRFGYRMYEGDVTASGTAGITALGNCEMFESNGYQVDFRAYGCDRLKPNTTYTVQLFAHETFNSAIRLAIAMSNTGPTKAPRPILSGIPASNRFGSLRFNAQNTLTDNLSCNSRHSLNNCGPIATAGVTVNNVKYTLSSFFTFTLQKTAKIRLTVNWRGCYYNNPLIRVYNQNASETCNSLNSTNLVGQSTQNLELDCLTPGTYTVQVMGSEALRPKSDFYYSYFYGYPICVFSNLGASFDLNINANEVPASNRFSLSTPGAFNGLNRVGTVLTPLQRGVRYSSIRDTFGCAQTVLPAGASCRGYNDQPAKAIYRQFTVKDSGFITIDDTRNYGSGYFLYRGNADSLAGVQNVRSFPGRINGLTLLTDCAQGFRDNGGCYPPRVCITPGTYSFVETTSQQTIGITSAPEFVFESNTPKHADPLRAQNLGDILSSIRNTGTRSVTSDDDFFSCKDNAVTIGGAAPCSFSGKPSTKAIYRQFYLSEPAKISISLGSPGANCVVGGYMSLFNGRATEGLNTLRPVGGTWSCFQYRTASDACDVLPAGWYTVVSYGAGPSYQSPTRDLGQFGYSSYVGVVNNFRIDVGQSCENPKFNRPFKASLDTVTKRPYLIQWRQQPGHTNAYPVTGTTYNLNQENFNCLPDTPFLKHPISGCDSSVTKVAYYIFEITQESYVEIDANSLWSVVYDFDVRRDSARMLTATPIQPCVSGYGRPIQLCRLQPGVYTLAIFASNANACSSVRPVMYVDQVGYSRFDHALNAYDFGVVRPDSAWYSGKRGDINPLNSGRAASNDFFYCTTGSQESDPTSFPGGSTTACIGDYNDLVYPSSMNRSFFKGKRNYYESSVRRNLWYTFVADKPGTVRVRVSNKTQGKSSNYAFFIYKSDADGNQRFEDLVSSGEVDSTIAQGLIPVGSNLQYAYYCSGPSEISFYREACGNKAERYYVVVYNRGDINSGSYNGLSPNHQVEVSVLVDSIDAQGTKFDKYSGAYNFGNLGVGRHRGAVDNYSCATRDLPDPVESYSASYCSKTLWYKFTTAVSGTIRYRLVINGESRFNYGSSDVQLLKQIRENDSTKNGLLFASYSTTYTDPSSNVWAQQCISPGTYYLLLPGCNRRDETVYPEIELIQSAGDFCLNPVAARLSGFGTTAVSAIVDCHSIGTDYGEFNQTLSCPPGAVTKDYKSTWFRIDVTGTDTVDLTVFLNENTNAAASDVQYRMMTGTCGAMQEQSCVQNALTKNTYKCLAPGNSYYIQVFTPVRKDGQLVNGTVELNMTTVRNGDTCLPSNNCIASPKFLVDYDCTKQDSVKFNNFSTFGSSIRYTWDFGDGSPRSTAVSPVHLYPVLASDRNYTVKLKIENTACGLVDSTQQVVRVPGRPFVNLGEDIISCQAGTTFVLDATTHTGTTYRWNTGSTQPRITTYASGGQYSYSVEATFNGCISRDEVKVFVNPIAKRPIEYLALCDQANISLSRYKGYSEQYQWSSGESTNSISVSQPGTYWVDIYLNGCTIRDTIIVAGRENLNPLGPDTRICQSALPLALNATVNGATAYQWQDNSRQSSFTVRQPGLYWVQLTLGGCTYRDSIRVEVDSVRNSAETATICAGATYRSPSGRLLSQTGVYADTVKNVRGCDSIITRVDLRVSSLTRQSLSASICRNQNYQLPSGRVVSTAGSYVDTVRTIQGCDSLITTVGLTINSFTTSMVNRTLCSGQTYNRPGGGVVSTTGTYIDTLRNSSGCDSIVTSNINFITLETRNINASVCSGLSYRMPTGRLVSTAGIHRDTFRSVQGCDSLQTVLTLQVNNPLRVESTERICLGSSFRLPSGRVVNTQNTFVDTIRNSVGCDSLISHINLIVLSPIRETRAGSICRNQTFTLPSGRIISNEGTYQDTVRYTIGCDSLITTFTLAINSVATVTVTRTLCAGQTYTWPGGVVVNTSGTYIDTLRNSSGCDSIVTSNINFIILETRNINASVCNGQSYRMPTGRLVSTTGIHRDTLRSVQGCDSLQTVLTLQVNNPLRVESTERICLGSSFRLPSGRVVNTQNTFVDTVRYSTGCDSLISRINLIVLSPIRETRAGSICRNQTFTLPSGRIISNEGTYQDTVRYTIGCDSLITTFTLTINSVTTVTVIRTLCTGQTYTRPGGVVVNTSGTYINTLRNSSGCDSIVTSIINFIILETRNINASVCSGQSYRMPTGRLVSTAGIHRDTLRSVQGCDSLQTVLTLQINNPLRVESTERICLGSSFRLPSGRVVNTQNTFVDTVRNSAGCDSLISRINLIVLSPIRETRAGSICRNQTVTLPSGRNISNEGTYQDTVRYTIGCDSLITTFTLTINPVTTVTVSRTLCAGQTYTRLGGVVVNTSGTYIDTLRNASGCDSIITTNLIVGPPLSVSLGGSLEICAGQSVTLTAAASGGLPTGYQYRWIGINGSGSQVSFTPTASIFVIVELTDGCTVLPARDTLSIRVIPNPVASFTASAKSGCAPVTVQFTNRSQSIDGSVYKWQFGTTLAADTSLLNNPSFIFTRAGRFAVGLTVTAPAGCVSTFTDTITVYDSPAPAIQAISSACLGTAIQFRDTGRGNAGDSWFWDFGNGIVSDQQDPGLVTYAAAGRFNISLRRSNAGGCSVLTTHELIVDQITASAGASVTQLCDSGRVQFTPVITAFSSNLPGSELQYLWDFGSGNASLIRNPSFFFARPGSYPVRLTVASNYGCTTTVVQNITVTQKLAASITGPAEICAGSSAAFSGAAIGTVNSWNWQIGNTVSTLQNPTAQVFTTPGTYPVRLITTSTAACPDTVTRTLIVRPNPVAGIDDRELELCRGNSVQLNVSDGVQYEWTPSAGLSNPRIANPVASPLTDTRYRVRVTNAFGCSSVDSVFIKVTQPFTVTTSADATICVGRSVQLNAAGAVRYQWTPAAGLNNASIANPVAQPTATTTYRVIGFGSDNCFTDTANVTVTVIPLPTVFAGRDTVISVGTELLLRPVVSSDVSRYIWTPSVNLSCSNCPTPSATPQSETSYTVTVSNDFGCTASDDIRISLTCSAKDVFLPNTFTPNGDGMNDIFYPRGKGIKIVKYLRIFNRWGELIFERKDFSIDDPRTGWDGVYKGERLSSGVFVYTTQMVCDNGQVIDTKGSVMIIR